MKKTIKGREVRLEAETKEDSDKLTDIVLNLLEDYKIRKRIKSP